MTWNPSLAELLGAAGLDGRKPAVVTLRIECDGAHSPQVVVQKVEHQKLAPRMAHPQHGRSAGMKRSFLFRPFFRFWRQQVRWLRTIWLTPTRRPN